MGWAAKGELNRPGGPFFEQPKPFIRKSHFAQRLDAFIVQVAADVLHVHGGRVVFTGECIVRDVHRQVDGNGSLSGQVAGFGQALKFFHEPLELLADILALCRDPVAGRPGR